MFKIRNLILGVLLASLLISCAPMLEMLQPPPPATETTPIIGMAVVQTVDVQFLESSPIKVNAIVRGQLPDAGCTTIAAVDQSQDGNTFRLTLVTTTDPLALCALALTPFEQVVSLDVNDLPAAKYIVSANGIEASFELLPRNVSIFKQELAEALNARDYELLRVMMNESLMIAPWRAEGSVYEVEPAIEQLRISYLNMTSPIIPDPQKNLISLLDGIDPVSVLSADVYSAGTLFVSGLGPEGRDEGILYLATLSDGGLYWYGLLFAQGGFTNTGSPQLVDLTAYSTDIQNVTAEQDLAVYSGPGSNYPVVGSLYRGQTAIVTGTNADGSWWRVVCTNNTAGDCWVSADRNLTRPSTTVYVNQPPQEPEKIPTITILAVIQNDQVTIRTQDFPADTKFFVRMGKIGTTGVDGILVETFDSKKGGSITTTFDIPSKLYGEKQIAIRLESQAGYYSYNWFDNITSGNSTSNPTDPQPTDVEYIIVKNSVSIYAGPGVKYGEVGSIAEGKIVKVIGISVDGKWWRITCLNATADSCWVTTKTKFTRPADES